ncbi:unnamed protein product, partial [Amoebophrya sp. A25]
SANGDDSYEVRHGGGRGGHDRATLPEGAEGSDSGLPRTVFNRAGVAPDIDPLGTSDDDRGMLVQNA